MKASKRSCTYRAVLLVVVAALSGGHVRHSPAQGANLDFAKVLEGARKEGIINIRMQSQPAGTEGRLESLFQKRFGFPVKVQISAQHPSDAQAMLVQEARAGRISSDLYYVGDATALPVKEAGAFQTGIDWLGIFGSAFDGAARKNLESMVSEMAAQSPDLKDSCLRWQDIYYAIVYNTRKFNAKSVPKSFDELLQPKYKGQVAWMNAGFPIGEIANAFGEEYALRYARALKENGVLLVSGGSAGVAEAVASGEAALGVAAENLALVKQAQGAPIATVLTKPEVLGFDFNFCVLKGPHPNMAKLFAAWLTSEARYEFLGPPHYYTRLSDTRGPISETHRKAGFKIEEFKPGRSPEAIAQRNRVRQKVLKEVWAK